MQLYTTFDGVASTAMFSAIVAVIGEDVSLGPVIYKAVFRSVGACIGGMCGFVMLYFPSSVFPNHKTACLLIIPAVFVSGVQYLVKGGNEYLTLLIKNNKANHLIIQLQAAFGVVYMGSWHTPDNAIVVASLRTFAIFCGCMILLFVSFLVLPDTSLHTSATEIDACLVAVGDLLIVACDDRKNGVHLPPYNHKGKVFGLDVTAGPVDPHMKLLDLIDTKITRGM